MCDQVDINEIQSKQQQHELIYDYIRDVMAHYGRKKTTIPTEMNNRTTIHKKTRNHTIPPPPLGLKNEPMRKSIGRTIILDGIQPNIVNETNSKVPKKYPYYVRDNIGKF